ncbi:hypothetical protein SSS_06144 [Sarcoptes scabiei]|uniref:Uncharacterized protein n=1 Tax=Sarcoptes scabiei TaxID=52283 RepID=A0A834R7I5_SARSC|nr:hypothetical protein SSS_06144 [Sarcoptes scabiei]
MEEESSIKSKSLALTRKIQRLHQALICNQLTVVSGKEELVKIHQTVEEIFDEIIDLDPLADEKKLSSLIPTYQKKFQGYLNEISEFINSNESENQNDIRVQEDVQETNGTFDAQSFNLMSSFSGNYLEFPRFWESFELHVDRTSLPDPVKFDYLIKKLDSTTTQKINTYRGSQYKQVKDYLFSYFFNEILIAKEMKRKLSKLGRFIKMFDVEALINVIDVLNTTLVVSERMRTSENLKQEILLEVTARFPPWFLSECRTASTLTIENVIDKLRNQCNYVETTADRVRRQNFPPKKEGPTISHVRRPPQSSRFLNCNNQPRDTMKELQVDRYQI